MQYVNQPVSYLIVCAMIAVAISSTGCTSIIAPAKTSTIAPGTPQYVVEMKGEGWKKVDQQQMPLTDDITIDDVLTASKAKQKFRNMEIEIVRHVPESGRYVKLPVDYRARNKSIPAEQNYAIHENDRIAIRQVFNTPLDEFVDSFFPDRK